jgi:hypothetical protein
MVTLAIALLLIYMTTSISPPHIKEYRSNSLSQPPQKTGGTARNPLAPHPAASAPSVPRAERSEGESAGSCLGPQQRETKNGVAKRLLEFKLHISLIKQLCVRIFGKKGSNFVQESAQLIPKGVNNRKTRAFARVFLS